MPDERQECEAAAAASGSVAPRVSFGPFVLDPTEPTLLRRGRPVELPERCLRLLVVLVRSAGRTVAKDRLIDEAWNGLCVTDSSLAEAMSRLRRALGDDPRQPAYIRTMHRRGYRFIATVGPEASGGRRHGAFVGLARTAASIAAGSMFVVLLWVASSVLDAGAGDRSARSARNRSTAELDPLRPLLGSIPRPTPPAARPEPPRYRLVTAMTGGRRPDTFRIPSLPINDLSVDRDSGRVAFSVAEGGESDVWVVEPGKGTLDRVASGGYFSDPVWTPDGRALAMARERGGDFDLVLQEAVAGGRSQVLLSAPLDQFPESWSRDGSALVYSERHPETGFDLWLLRRRSARAWASAPLVRTAGHEAFAALSPDGRYVAFASDIDRRPEIFVVDLERDGTTARISQGGGMYPFWSARGDLLHYVKGDEVWSTATNELGGTIPPVSRRSASAAGLYLAGSRVDGSFVMAVLDESPPASAFKN